MSRGNSKVRAITGLAVDSGPSDDALAVRVVGAVMVLNTGNVNIMIPDGATRELVLAAIHDVTGQALAQMRRVVQPVNGVLHGGPK
jgi:hypothetical protein